MKKAKEIPNNTYIHFKMQENLNESIRLNKYISESGFLSRRKADDAIMNGFVTINGEVADVGMKVTTSDVVKVHGHIIKPTSDKIYIALNKPIGILCITDELIEDNIITFMDYKETIFPIGRLDRNSEGLILLTNDGDIVNKILRVENGHDKTYFVRTDKPIDDDFIETMALGVEIYNPVKHQIEQTRPAKIQKLSDTTFEISIDQGLNRQIRRMVDALGNKVVQLKRTRIMNIELGDLKSGYWRYLSKMELETLQHLLIDSQNHIEKSVDF